MRVEVYKDSMGHVINAPESSEKETYRFYTNYFGLNSFDTERREFAKTSGVVTEAIPVKKGVPLKLYADVQCGDGASVEFSVMDGARELSASRRDFPARMIPTTGTANPSASLATSSLRTGRRIATPII